MQVLGDVRVELENYLFGGLRAALKLLYDSGLAGQAMCEQGFDVALVVVDVATMSRVEALVLRSIDQDLERLEIGGDITIGWWDDRG